MLKTLVDAANVDIWRIFRLLRSRIWIKEMRTERSAYRMCMTADFLRRDERVDAAAVHYAAVSDEEGVRERANVDKRGQK